VVGHSKSKTRPSGTNSWICGRYLYRAVTEKRAFSLSGRPF
jgi:hypothetical protein